MYTSCPVKFHGPFTHQTPLNPVKHSHAPGNKGEEDGHDVQQALRGLHLEPAGREDLLERDVRAEEEVEPLQDAPLQQVVQALGVCDVGVVEVGCKGMGQMGSVHQHTHTNIHARMHAPAWLQSGI